MTRVLRWLAAVLIAGLAVVTLLVEREARPALESAGGFGPDRALVLYHPSRDARFSEQLAAAVAEGFAAEGFKVEIARTTKEAPDAVAYSHVAVIANTYWWTPDLPTLRYLKRSDFGGRAVLGLIAGAGSTGRAQRVLERQLDAAHATVWDVQPFWTWRPNDESRRGVPNRQVAADKARALAAEFARAVLLGNVVPLRQRREQAARDSAGRPR